MTIRFASRATGVALVLMLAGLWAAPGAHAQTGEDALRLTQRMPATGARMIGLAGAGIAGIADYTALYTNPAGLGYFKQSLVAGALSSFSTTEETAYRVPGLNDAFNEADIRDTQLGNFGYIYRAPTTQGSFVVGVGYNQINTFDRNLVFGGTNATNSITDSFLPYPSEFEVAEDAQGYYPRFFNVVPELAYEAGAIEFLYENVGTQEPLFYQAVVPGSTIEQDGDVVEEGRMSELNIGGAVEAVQGVMVGLSANLTFGSYRFDSRFEEDDVRNENQEDDYVVILEDGELRGFNYLTYLQGYESDLTGFSLRGGVATEVAPSVRLGVSVETPTFFSVQEDYYRELETGFDVGGSLSASENGQFEYQIRTPWRLGAGLAYFTDALLVSADVEYVDWSQLELDASTDDFTDVNRNIRNNLEPVFNTRIGGEYRLGNLLLRAGFALQPDPRSYEIEFEGEETDRTRTFYAAGLGYQFAEQFQIDLGWVQERFDDLYNPYLDVETPPVVEESVVRNRFSLGVRIAF